MNLSKAIRLLSLLPTRPLEFYDRLATVVEVNKERQENRGAGENISFLDALAAALNLSTLKILDLLKEQELKRTESRVLSAITSTEINTPFDSGHDGDFSLARSIYIVCRVLAPDVVIETGVAHGVSSAFALQALAINQKGTLFSIDLPPLEAQADEHVGVFVMPQLKKRWRLNRGPTKRVLPKILPAVQQVDVFVHDSLHTYRNMEFEFRTIWPYLRPGGALIADDVGLNGAFEDFVADVQPKFWAIVRQERKDALFGLLVKGS